MSGAAPTREVAYRVFADEYAQATYSYAESDDDRAPQYLVTPTGARVNRVFVVGVLTETEEVSDGVLRARIVDPTGAFVLYAGQYQPDALAFFERTEAPAFVAVTGKARTFEPEGSDRVYTSLRPERANEVDAATRDRWNLETASQTLARSSLLAQALDAPERGSELRTRLREAGVEPGLAAGIPHAIREYEPTTAYLAAVQEMALDVVRVVADEIGEVSTVAGAPDAEGTGEVRTGFADVTLAPAVEPDAGGTDVAADTEDGESSGPDEETSEPSDPEGEASDPGETDPEESDSEETEPEESELEASAPEESEPVSSEPAESEPSEPAKPEAEDSEPVEAEPDESVAAEPEPEESETAEPAEPETEPPESEPGADDVAGEETDEFYELSAEERAEVEENYDVGFESGADVGSPEETPDIEPEAGAPAESGADEESDQSEAEAETGAGDSDETAGAEADDTATEDDEDTASDASADAETDSETFTEGELQNLVIDTLQELGDGDGVPRENLIDALQDRHDLEADDIEDAIQAALLGGRCFESGADHLKPI